MQTDLPWDYPNPHRIDIAVTEDDLDGLGHVNNVRYLHWLERVAWDHSNALGLDFAAYQRLGCAAVARRHEIDYLAATYAGDDVAVATWITKNDGKLSLWRHYQGIRLADHKTVVRGMTHWVCVDLESGRPRRMPPEFVQGYAPTVPDDA